MKKISILLVTLFVTIAIKAQTINDVLSAGTENLQGTARYQAMSGAFGALGGDLSALNNNPASSAVFLNSYITVSGNNHYISNDTRYGGGPNFNQNSSDLNINQIGAVLVLKNSNDSSDWKKLSFAFNYDIANNFDNTFFASGNSSTSIDQYFLNYAQGQALGPLFVQSGELIEDAYLNIGSDLGYGTQQAFLGFQSYIIEPEDIDDDENTSYYSNADFSSVNQSYFVSTTGLNSKFTANMAAQYGDNLYLGASLNFNVIDKETLTQFDEDGYSAGSPLEFVQFDNYLRTYGNGFSFSLGGIAKVNELIRLGASYQSPTWYRLTDELSQFINTNSAEVENQDLTYINFDLVNVFPDYKIQIPAKLTASAALVFEQYGLLSFDYGYQDMSNAVLKPKTDPDFAAENEFIENSLKAVSTFKIGGEYRIKQLSLRGGYRFEESPYKNGDMIGDLNGFSLGAGYSFGATKVDLSYSQSQRDINHQLFATGLTNTAAIDSKNTNVTLSVSFNL